MRLLGHASSPSYLHDGVAVAAEMDTLAGVAVVQAVLVAALAAAADVKAFHFQVRLPHEEQRGQAQVRRASNHEGH